MFVLKILSNHNRKSIWHFLQIQFFFFKDWCFVNDVVIKTLFTIQRTGVNFINILHAHFLYESTILVPKFPTKAVFWVWLKFLALLKSRPDKFDEIDSWQVTFLESPTNTKTADNKEALFFTKKAPFWGYLYKKPVNNKFWVQNWNHK